jgi:aminopeptidase
MRDVRCDRLADLIVRYSLKLEPGQTVSIEGLADAKPLLLALYRAALAAGAHPQVLPRFEEPEEILLAEASDEQLAWVSELELHRVTHIDARVTLYAEANTRRHTGVDPVRHAAYVSARRTLGNAFNDRVDSGEARWCGTLYPTTGHAQDAGMSTTEFEDFVFHACHVDGEDDPVAFWEGFASELRARAASLDAVRELRFLGEGTDLTVGLEGRRWLTGDGTHNMPCGEIFTSPVETATRGEVAFSMPASFAGRDVHGIRLRFEEGRVVHAEAREGEEHLRSLLAMDDGASILGEAALGLNYGIDRHTGNTLFDEKIGGTIHLALGLGFAQAGGLNRSALHWDIVTGLGAGGEIQADGETIWRDGHFLD